MSIRRNTLIAGVIAVLLHPGASTQGDPTQLLVEQGLYWQEKGDPDRAEEAWQKLLRMQTNHPRALYGLGMAALLRKQEAQARGYVVQLRQAGEERLADQLEQEITLTTGAAPLRLEQARQAAQQGDTTAAVSEYREVFGTVQPRGTVGVEYYQTLAGTEGGWEEARRGLQEIVEAEPDNDKAKLALAQLLTYQENTRREGISQLAALANQAGVGAEATRSWRQALLWLGDPPPLKIGPAFKPIWLNIPMTQKSPRACRRCSKTRLGPRLSVGPRPIIPSHWATKPVLKLWRLVI